MIYVAWSQEDICGLNKDKIALLWTEVDEGGVVRREIGFDACGRVVHKIPSGGKRFGYFDNQVVDLTGVRNDVTCADFNSCWEDARCPT